jgi:phytoene synthase
MNPIHKRIFKNGSKTYYYSSFFFPPNVKEDVFKLYSFLRKADDFVDSVPQQKTEFYDFKKRYENALEGESTGDVVIDSLIELVDRKRFDPSWVEAFLYSMESDLYINSYETLESLRKYLYGSAEVVGLMVARILDLPEESYNSAMHLGRAMQYVNSIRDINEDLLLGRNYFPRKEFIEYNLESLEQHEACKNPIGFNRFIHTQLDRFEKWQAEAEKGFKYIPKRYLIPIKTASEMYKWTAKIIEKDPFIVYDRKVKPSISRIIVNVGKNAVFA